MLLLDFSLLSMLVLDFSLLSMLSLDFSLCPVLGLDFSRCSVLALDFWSVAISEFSDCSLLSSDSIIWRGGSFSTAVMNFLRCLKYSGKSSRLQWFPPISHKGSYFSLQSSQSCLPWETSTTSSSVPCNYH
ncbi:hypothetical protein F2P56_036026 [Juglans regia]|uniref:Secreted protein n=1 Tax=Juglans regia TaxID=51240 RepID=A0A833TKZ0_JUGRE|nr:hypothetical protein F2P56_036026 [Juglans regia]